MQPHHKPLAAYRSISIASCVLLIVAFVLFLLVGLSLTIIKPIYLLIFRSTAPVTQPLSIATELRFGVWGVCATSNLNQPTPISNPGLCFGPQLGYTVPDYIITTLALSPTLISSVQQALLVILILHPITAALAFLAALPSLFLLSHGAAIAALALSVVAALVGSTILGVDLALVLVAQKQVRGVQGFEFEVLFGNGVWMVVAGVVLLWAAVVLLSMRACFCLGVRRHSGEHHHHHHHEIAVEKAAY